MFLLVIVEHGRSDNSEHPLMTKILTIIASLLTMVSATRCVMPVTAELAIHISAIASKADIGTTAKFIGADSIRVSADLVIINCAVNNV